MQVNLSSGFPTRSNTDLIVQPQKAKGLKILILKVKVLFYLCSEIKGTDQRQG